MSSAALKFTPCFVDIKVFIWVMFWFRYFVDIFFFINSPVRTLKAGFDGEVGYCEVNLVTAYFAFKYFLQTVSFLFTPAPSLFFVTTENKIDWTLFTLDATGLTVFVFLFFFFSQCQCYFRFRHYPGVKKTIFLFFVTHTLILIVFNDKFCLHCLKVIFLLNNSHRFLPSFRARPNWETHAKRLFYSIVYRDFTSRKTFALFFCCLLCHRGFIRLNSLLIHYG